MNENQLNIILKSVQQNSKVLIVNCDSIDASDVKMIGDFCRFVCVATDNSLVKESLQHKLKLNRSKFICSSTSKIPNIKYDVLVLPYLNEAFANLILSIKSSLNKIVALMPIQKLPNIRDAQLINQNVVDLSATNKVEIKAPTIINDDKPRKLDNKCSFFIVNYNTSDLINLLVHSIHTFIKSFKYDIWIFDNSDKEVLKLKEKYDDVHILDNTKGQLINYDEAIKKYCVNNPSTNAKTIGFISMKHALAVQYGFDHPDISDNFILCDSDIVIKKDLDFIDENQSMIGEIRHYPRAVSRILPFLCYLNKNMLKEFNISYFNSVKMHGCKDEQGKFRLGYDTGAYVLEKAQEMHLPIKIIDINEYCIHFGSYSRKDRYCAPAFYDKDNIQKLLFKYNEYVNAYNYTKLKNNIMHELITNNYAYKSNGKKYAIYTCITNGYDNLIEQSHYDHEKFDYICFTNSNIQPNENWKIVKINGLSDLLYENDQTKLARFVKMHPHLFLVGYKKSIWIDANIRILSNDIENDFMKFLISGEYLLTSQHPKLTNVFDEIEKCKGLRKDSVENLDKIKTLLENEHFNNKYEHVQTNIILRDHNNKECQKIMEAWWEMIKNYSKRDQTSFNYVFWKNDGKFLSLPFEHMNKLFTTDYAHHKK